MSYKTLRIETEISRHLNNILLKETKNSKLKKVTITGVEVSSDISIAKIFYTALDTSREEIQKELDASSSFFRTKLSSVMNLRHTPKIEFSFDESIEYGANIENIIKKIK